MQCTVQKHSISDAFVSPVVSFINTFQLCFLALDSLPVSLDSRPDCSVCLQAKWLIA